MMLKDGTAYELAHLLEGWKRGVSGSVNCAQLPWMMRLRTTARFSGFALSHFYTWRARCGAIVPRDENSNSQSVDLLSSMERGEWKLMGAGAEQCGEFRIMEGQGFPTPSLLCAGSFFLEPLFSHPLRWSHSSHKHSEDWMA